MVPELDSESTTAAVQVLEEITKISKDEYTSRTVEVWYSDISVNKRMLNIDRISVLTIEGKLG